ncbi:glycosyl transferase family protein [Candidatus Omnitrophus magneticus]|uniref:Glycosyl transferase family protein n=1 Tax=Candidatus Omnitrophus magneticus TaxID=1609969 RepID=A0A0F0CR26_9BACT|nr:glycosyl transferase family protein [Candidatus Omnitrophus magneticus]
MKYIYKKKNYKLFFYVLDAFLSAGVFIAKLFFKKRNTDIKNILVIRIDHIGDVINASIVLEPIRKTFPFARIDFLAPSWAYSIVEHNPFIDKVIKFVPPWFSRPSRGIFAQIKGVAALSKIIKVGGYDAVIDLRGDFRHILAMFIVRVQCRVGYGITGGKALLTNSPEYRDIILHESIRNLELLKSIGVSAPSAELKLYFSQTAENNAKQILRDFNIFKKYIVFHMFPGHESKVWEFEKFFTVMKHVWEQKKLIPVIIGGREDREKIEALIQKSSLNIPRIVNLAGMAGLGEVYYILRGADIFIGVDSAPAHLSAIAGAKTIVLFSGINEPRQWAPRASNVKIVFPGSGKSLANISAKDVCGVIDEIFWGTITEE